MVQEKKIEEQLEKQIRDLMVQEEQMEPKLLKRKKKRCKKQSGSDISSEDESTELKENKATRKKQKKRLDVPFKGIKTELAKFWQKIEEIENNRRTDMSILNNMITNFRLLFSENIKKDYNLIFLEKNIEDIIIYIYNVAIPKKIHYLKENKTRSGKPIINQDERINSIAFYEASLVKFDKFSFEAYFDVKSLAILKETYHFYVRELQRPENLANYLSKIKRKNKIYIRNAKTIITKFEEYLRIPKKIKNSFYNDIDIDIE